MKVICAAVQLEAYDPLIFQHELDELADLAHSLNYEIVDTVIQKARSWDPVGYFRKGKIEEIKMLIQTLDAEALLLNDEISPAIEEYLSRTLDTMIIDRTFLILETFKERSQTRVSQLQVEMALLTYQLPRLGQMKIQGDRSGGGIGAKGSGETALDLKKDLAIKRILRLRKELAECTQSRATARKSQSDHGLYKVALAGYTNAGKSTLMNALLDYTQAKGKEVVAKDQLFCTLETKTRHLAYNHHEFLLTDTVGFLQKLPHSLIDAFHSTLEEITEADLILLVADATDPFYQKGIETSLNVLNHLGIKDIPIIYVFTKIDKLNGDFYIPPLYNEAIAISSLNRLNFEHLLDMIIQHMDEGFQEWSGLLPYGSKEIDQIKSIGSIKFIEKCDDGLWIDALVPESYLEHLASLARHH